MWGESLNADAGGRQCQDRALLNVGRWETPEMLAGDADCLFFVSSRLRDIKMAVFGCKRLIFVLLQLRMQTVD